MQILCWIIMFVCFWSTSIESKVLPCTTPNGEKAMCRDLIDCDILLQAAASKHPTSVKFFKASKCGDFQVCCGTLGNYTDPPSLMPIITTRMGENVGNQTHKDLVLKTLLPDKRYCGLRHEDDYYYNYTAAEVEDFPWLVYISLYNETTEGLNETYELRCSGVIISNRYVLTASECNALPFDTVIVGKYKRFQNVQCDYDSDNNDDNCSLEKAVPVQEKIVSNYEILLIRVAEEIFYNDFVRPICLPLNDSERPKPGDRLFSSGWGDITLEHSNVQAKKKVQHVVANITDSRLFVNSVDYNHCFGDEGGPLISQRGKLKQCFVEAIMPPYFCLRGFPARRINHETLDWILENIRS